MNTSPAAPRPALTSERLASATAAVAGLLEAFRESSKTGLNKQHAAAAFAAIRETRQLMANTPAPQLALLKKELAAYRAILSECRSQLPRLHGWLLADRARIEGRQMHTRAVSGWAEADRQTR